MLDLLLTRRSVTAKDLAAPGPTPQQTQQILQAAHRVPDHGKIGPWRFVVFEGDARKRFGETLAAIYEQDNQDASAKLLEFQRQTLVRAPLVIAVISTAVKHVKVPEWEQVLSAGAACQNILLAAASLGFGAQWLSEWYSYHEKVHQVLGLEAHQNIAGFMYIGTVANPPSERVRPALDERISYF